MEPGMNLLMQMLLGGGAGLSGAPWAKNVANIGMNTLQSQNQWNAIMGSGGQNNRNSMAAIMKQIMQGNMPGASMKADGEKGMSFNFEPKALGSIFGGESKMGQEFKGTQPNFGTLPNEGLNFPETPSAEMSPSYYAGTRMMDTMSSLLNPSVSQPGTSMPNLAGLTPQDVNNIVQARLDLRQQTVAEAMQPLEMLYKGTLTRESLARAERMNLPEDTRTAAIKNYEYAREGGYTGTFDEFVGEKGGEPTSVEEWKQAVAGGYEGSYYQWKKEMTALGGGLSLGEKVEQAEAMADVKSKKWFSSPTGIGKAADDYIKSEAVQNQLFPLMDDPQNYARTKSKLMEDWHVKQIKAAGGEILEARLDGKDFVWKVRWPDGTTSEVRYAN